MKVIKVISNRLRPTVKRVLKLKLACGHVLTLTQEPHMKPPKTWRSQCRACLYGDPIP